ncbi:MAG: 30S ribosome-binding factor RbfA [Clostridia bacterium]|nr:30S ribosome-binding factor RbfA [Clostridia bacterium]MEE1126344.1 30S ribosome-binding factor RbfA [Acutalibacteraceae bacterium]
MAGFRMGRTTEDVRRELTAILREMKDPRVSDAMISVVRVEVTNDLSYCSVYISSMYGMEKSKEAAKALKNAAGYIRKELGSRLKLRHVPAPLFYATDSIEYSANINKLLLDLDIPEEDETDETDE